MQLSVRNQYIQFSFKVYYFCKSVVKCTYFHNAEGLSPSHLLIRGSNNAILECKDVWHNINFLDQAREQQFADCSVKSIIIIISNHHHNYNIMADELCKTLMCLLAHINLGETLWSLTKPYYCDDALKAAPSQSSAPKPNKELHCAAELPL